MLMSTKFFIIQILIYYIYGINKIEIPFKSKKSIDYLDNRFLSEIYDINLYTSIEIGSNNQKFEVPIKINKYLTYVISTKNINLNSSKFNYNLSTSYNKIDDVLFNSTDDDFISGYKSSDNFIIGNNYISNITFFLSNNQTIDESGTLGLKVQPITKEMPYINSTGIIDQLKKKKITSSYNFYFKFDKSEKLGEYKGKLIIGGMPHDIEPSKLFKEDNFVNANIQGNKFNTTWNLYFMKINYGHIQVEEQHSVTLSTTFGLIHAPIFFESSMKKYFFDKNNCSQGNNGYFKYFYCEENVDISKFENLYFESLYQEINFTLTYKDLFYKIYNKNYFLILFNEDTYIWKFGIHFLSKFTLVFNTDNKTIGYYYSPGNEEEESVDANKDGNKNYILYILFIISFIVIIILLGIIFYLISLINRKLRPNELEDEYDYNSKINE